MASEYFVKLSKYNVNRVAYLMIGKYVRERCRGLNLRLLDGETSFQPWNHVNRPHHHLYHLLHQHHDHHLGDQIGRHFKVLGSKISTK